MTPLFFGDTNERLYGVYHRPGERTGATARSSGIVICGPIRDEYVASHRAIRQLALVLSDAGFPVLRFDYYGAGDSAGSSEEGAPDRWVSDISLAATELQKLAGVASVHLVGLRLGGNFALVHARRSDDVAGVVLWNPVVSGDAYLAELVEEHSSLLENMYRTDVENNREHWLAEGLYGYPITETLLAEFEAIRLTAADLSIGKKLLCLDLQEEGSEPLFVEHKAVDNSLVKIDTIQGQAVWKERSLNSNVLVPRDCLNTISSWLQESQ
jgi:pimeloyl-ACP methyl ester carboxylesterase